MNWCCKINQCVVCNIAKLVLQKFLVVLWRIGALRADTFGSYQKSFGNISGGFDIRAAAGGKDDNF
jgi:hypothetical protein